jgi:hypothetical protein
VEAKENGIYGGLRQTSKGENVVAFLSFSNLISEINEIEQWKFIW